MVLLSKYYYYYSKVIVIIVTVIIIITTTILTPMMMMLLRRIADTDTHENDANTNGHTITGFRLRLHVSALGRVGDLGCDCMSAFIA